MKSWSQLSGQFDQEALILIPRSVEPFVNGLGDSKQKNQLKNHRSCLPKNNPPVGVMHQLLGLGHFQ